MPGEASITRSNLSRGGEEIRGYRVVYRAISRSRLEYTVDRVASKDIDRLVKGSRPNITIITRAKKWAVSAFIIICSAHVHWFLRPLNAMRYAESHEISKYEGR
jgi:hypothetical protein